MAVKKRESLNRLKQYETSTLNPAVDKTLEDVLSASHTHITVRNGAFYSVNDLTGEEIESKEAGRRKYENAKKEAAAQKEPEFVANYDEAQELTREFESELENPETIKAMMREQAEDVRKLTGRRVVEFAISFALILLVGFFALLMLYPQTELSELSRDNSNLKDEITTLKAAILDAEENANGVTDMDTVRAQALALGMQDPNQNQVIYLPIPNVDTLKTSISYDSDEINPEVLEKAEEDLAEYYRENPGA